MKRLTLGLVVALLLALPAAASAQAAVGLRGGMRWSQLASAQESGSVESLVLGGYFGFGISSRLALQLEAVYGTRGGDEFAVGLDQLDAAAPESSIEMSYVEIPVLLRAGFPGQRFLPSFFIGPYIGFLLDCELKPAGDEARACDTEGAPQRFTPRATDFGVVAGGGLDVAVGESTVFLDARYSLGFLSIEAGDETLDARHTGLAVSAGFAVPLGQ